MSVEWLWLQNTLAWFTQLALFLLLPYSKFVHGLYRALALLRDRRERAASTKG